MDKKTKKAAAIVGGSLLVICLIVGVQSIEKYIKDQNQKTAAAEVLIGQQTEAIAQAQEKIDAIENQNKTAQNEVNNLKNKVAAVDNTKSISAADIVSEWQNRIAQVTCEWDYTNGQTYEQQEASSTLVNVAGHGLTAVTNKHVIYDTTGKYIPNKCLIGIYGMGGRFISSNTAFDTGDDDSAYIYLNIYDRASDQGSWDTNVSSHLNICQESQVNVGDRVVILGYPAIGTNDGVTATDGIISGIESNYYVTSAKIDHGNSGGAAIQLKNDCWLGIPTWAATGTIESLGRILKAKFALE